MRLYWWEDAACRTADADLFFTPEGVTKEQAAELKKKLEEAGATVEVK